MIEIADIALAADWKKAQDAVALGDRVGALVVFRKMVEQEFQYAFFEVANILEFGGDNLKPDIGEAIMWYRRAADEIKDEYAIFSLARLYSMGKGLSRDDQKAYYYYYMLKDSKQLGAIYILGVMNEKGWGTEKSIDSAFSFYEIASSGGHLLALFRLGVLNIKKLRIVFGLKCIFRARKKIKEVSLVDPKDWRLCVKRMSYDTQDESSFDRHG